MMPIGENNDAAYHPFLRRGPRCVPHLVQSVPVDKVPRTLWCLDTEFHKWPGHRFPFIALLLMVLINLLKIRSHYSPLLDYCQNFYKDSHFAMEYRHYWLHVSKVTIPHSDLYLLRNDHWKTSMNHMRALLRQPCSMYITLLKMLVGTFCFVL